MIQVHRMLSINVSFLVYQTYNIMYYRSQTGNQPSRSSNYCLGQDKPRYRKQFGPATERLGDDRYAIRFSIRINDERSTKQRKCRDVKHGSRWMKETQNLRIKGNKQTICFIAKLLVLVSTASTKLLSCALFSFCERPQPSNTAGLQQHCFASRTELVLRVYD